MRVSDYIFNYLESKGADTVFMVTGGQAMFLVDAVEQNKKFKAICTHHEQSAGMAAEAYARITGKIGVALVTAGPGAVNVINGVVGGWTDSSPMIIISGQSNLAAVQYQQKTHIRQYGIQGINIKPLVESVTKYFITVDDPNKIGFYMEKAYHLAMSGRPGPVWIDVPLDIQKAEVVLDRMVKYDSSAEVTLSSVNLHQISKSIDLLSESKRPVFLVGQGVRIAGVVDKFVKLAEYLNVPVITSRLGIDIIHSDHPLYIGRPGNYGERSANFALQNADLIISIGCRLATALVGHDSKNFGKHAKKIVIDIDSEELNKPGFDIDLKIHGDARSFILEMYSVIREKKFPDYIEWVDICLNWKKKYPVVLSEYKKEKPVNSYYFTDRLSELSSTEDMIMVDTGSCFHVACQAWKVKSGQRFLTTGGLSSMGYWVAGIGACVANNYKRTIVITGDGSLQMNLQEFATIKHNNLPVKVFIFNNNGYLLIRHTQRNFMDGRLFGEGPETGVWCPDSLEIAKAYGIKGIRISTPEEVDSKIKEAMDYDGPVIIDVMTPEWQLLIPRVSSEKLADGTMISKPYEDMFPFLDREEFYANMIAEKKIE